ncbi:MAG: GTPase domain-containing protein [Tepidisphaeraceae bacterium]|jgi:hypothetical protein
MLSSTRSLESQLQAIDARAAAIRADLPAIHGWREDAQAVLFHLYRHDNQPIILCILGGTGTGKSTLVNRLLSANLTAASFKRTFTAGPIAIVKENSAPPEGWLGLPHITASEIPARGQTDSLLLVPAKHELLDHLILVDTPDLDGDQPTHHAQADRAFRWGQAILFLVSPEKYQMTELMPYYRVARRYGLPAIFVMNKCLTAQMLEDYRNLLEAEYPGANLFAIPRDDAGYEPQPRENLSALGQSLAQLQLPDAARQEPARRIRVADLLGRLRDQVIAPLRKDRREADVILGSMRAMETPPAGVDVNPITEQLQRRLQQRSVLYLIGPGRILDRVRQMPQMLVRLPRTAWDILMGRDGPPKPPDPAVAEARQVPDFNRVLSDQLAIIQSRIDDIVRSTPAGQRWFADPANGYDTSKIDLSEAGKIADEELKELNDWLTRRWNATPRDTALLLKLVRHLPGGEKLTQWTETAPYLLAIIVAAHHAFFGHIDLMILGGYSLATWLTERLSNEVAARTRLANRTIAERFEKLAHEQILRTIKWIESRVPSSTELDGIESAADKLQEGLGT